MPSPHATEWRGSRSRRGVSLPELLIVLALTGIVSSAALHALGDLRDERAGREAARGVVADLRRVAQAARHARRALAIEFQPGDDAAWRVIADGNGNGVTMADVSAGIDVPEAWTPVFREGRASLAITRAVPDTDGSGSIAAGSAPVRFGVMPRVIFTPRGTATAGSIFVAGRGNRMYAIRVLGSTQRVRLLCLSQVDAWEAC